MTAAAGSGTCALTFGRKLIMFQRGDIVEVDGILGAVVQVTGEVGVPDDHVVIWFGEPRGIRISEGGPGRTIPEVWTIPADLCIPARASKVNH